MVRRPPFYKIKNHTEMSNARAWMKRYMSVSTLIVIGVLVYIVFFGDSSVARRVEYQQQIDSLRAEVELVQDSVNYYRELNRRLSSDPEAMERVVREQYNMKREGEDVFVME